MSTAVVLKGDPFSWKAIQAYKIAAALSQKEEVFFIAIKEGVYFFKDWNPEALEYENFKTYKVNEKNLKLIADKDDFTVRGLDKTPLWVKKDNLKLAEEEEIKELLKRSKIVGVW
jgi:tRNA 2-thiouridine synthesizing protein C